MSGQGKFDAWTLVAKNDLSNTTPGAAGALYKAVGYLTGDFVANAAGLCGLLQEGCSSGGHAGVGYWGIMKAYFATAVATIGLDLTVTTSGAITLAASGDFVVGRNLTAVTSSQVAPGMFNFVNPWYFESY